MTLHYEKHNLTRAAVARFEPTLGCVALFQRQPGATHEHVARMFNLLVAKCVRAGDAWNVGLVVLPEDGLYIAVCDPDALRNTEEVVVVAH